MAQKWDPEIQTFRSDANFSATKFHIVKLDSDNDIALCGSGQLAVGVLTENVGESDTNEKFVSVQVGKIVKVEAGGSVTGGTLVMSNAAGEAVTGTDGNYVIGQALQDAADGEYMAVMWAPSYLETT